MTWPHAMHLWPVAISIILSCCLNLDANGQPDPKQAICEAAWERCLGTGGGKNWKPIYDRCLKARATCLGGRAYLPDVPAQSVSSLPQQSFPQIDGSGSDQANADPATQNARCAEGTVRGARNVCVLADAGDGYGQAFSLLGPAVPSSRMQRASSVVKCAGGKPASFYPNGRIESCTLDNNGEVQIRLTNMSGGIADCPARSLVRFDPEGRLVSCGPL